MPYVTFKMPTGIYMYNRINNTLSSINEEEYKEIQVNEYSFNKFKQNEEYDDSEEYKIEHPATCAAKFILGNSIENIVLQVTQNCNLRCSYCTYSEKYNNRKHSDKRMSLETAKRAIDFGIKHSSDNKELAVGFYGGEPLLEFDLIKQVVLYIEREYSQRKIRYNLTTNATLLNDEVLEFFNDKKIYPTISLDGPKDVHDKERQFSSGKGSYEIVMKNLENAKQRLPDFYTMFKTNSVMTPGKDYKEITDFLDKNEVIADIHSILGMVSEVGSKEKIVFSEDAELYESEMKMKVMLSMLGLFSEKNISPIFLNKKSDIIFFYKSLIESKSFGEKGHPGGPCVPGVKKTFVDVNGVFYPCEKIAELPSMQIGDLINGYSMEKVEEFLNVALVTEKECKSCWAFHFCTSCVAASGDDGLCRETRISNCGKVKSSAISTLMDIALLQDLGYEFDLNKKS